MEVDMNTIFLRLITCLVLLCFGCQKNYNDTSDLSLSKQANSTRTTGSIQISGIGFFDAADACNSAGQGASYALTLTGDLEGCHYFFVEYFECSPSGTYREQGRELFIGTYKGEAGTFWTTYRFEAKYEGCAENGSYIGAEILGRCQHPIVTGSGTGVFEGVTGRLDFKDDIEAGNFPYRGHLRWQ
jgi:hypothetical protein